MLNLADKQANFHQDSYWILKSLDVEEKKYCQNSEGTIRRFKELSVKWIGRESVINWLVSNQILFEVKSHDFLPEEQAVINESYQIEDCNSEPNNLN